MEIDEKIPESFELQKEDDYKRMHRTEEETILDSYLMDINVDDLKIISRFYTAISKNPE
jgi:hypothetical protein